MQQINLYQKEFHVSYNWRRIVVAGSMTMLLLVLAGININQMYTADRLRAELENTNNTIKSLKQSYSALAKNAKPKARDLNLIAELERIKRSNGEKLRALNYLSGNDAGNMTGFSFLLQGLGRKRDIINDLWLKKIKFSHGGYDLRLSGSSYQADLLPKFIQALGDEEIYKDREFRELKISRSDGNKKVMDFVLDTRHQTDNYGATVKDASAALFMARLKQLAGEKEMVR